MKKIVYTLLQVGIYGRLLGQTAPGNVRPDSLHMRSLEQVTITASRHGAEDTSGTPLQVLKGAALERLNNLSVADAVRYFSGVQLKDYGGVGGLKTINVRSMGSNHTAVFYDGIRLGNAQNGQVDLGKFSLDNIDEIALYEGQKSTIFQPATGFASGNALYLRARQPAFDKDQRSKEKISFKGGSFGLVNPSFLWQYRLSDRAYTSLSTEWVHANGRYKFRYTNGVYDTTAMRSNGDIDAKRVEASLHVRGRDSGTWSARMYFYHSARGLPGAVVANHFDYDQRLWDRNIFFQSSYHKEWRRYSLLLNAKYAYDYSRYVDPDYVTTSGLLDNRYHEQELYVSVAQRYAVTSFLDIAFSSDYRWDRLDANLYHFAYPTRDIWLNALAAELHFSRLNIQASMLSTVVYDRVRQFAGAGAKSELSPTVLFSWKLTGNGCGSDLRIRGFYKDIFRMPTFNDLYYTFIGNTYLRPEFVKQLDAGMTYRRTRPSRILTELFVQADGYINHITDKIVAVPGANLFRWTMLNLGKVVVHGLELNVRTGWRAGHDLLLRTGLSYTYEQALDMTGGDNYKQQIPYTPLNSSSLLAGAEWRSFSLDYSFIYTGSRYDQSANIPVNYLQPWYTHDLALTEVTHIYGHLAKATAGVSNLMDQHYDVITNFPMPGRNYRLTIQLNFP